MVQEWTNKASPVEINLRAKNCFIILMSSAERRLGKVRHADGGKKGSYHHYASNYLIRGIYSL